MTDLKKIEKAKRNFNWEIRSIARLNVARRLDAVTGNLSAMESELIGIGKEVERLINTYENLSDATGQDYRIARFDDMAFDVEVRTEYADIVEYFTKRLKEVVDRTNLIKNEAKFRLGRMPAEPEGD